MGDGGGGMWLGISEGWRWRDVISEGWRWRDVISGGWRWRDMGARG